MTHVSVVGSLEKPQQLQQSKHNTAAEVAQQLSCEKCEPARDSIVDRDHGEHEGNDHVLQESGCTNAVSRGPEDVVHDNGQPTTHRSTTRGDQPSTMGLNGACSRQTSGKDIHGCGQGGSRLCQMDQATSEPGERLGSLLPRICESVGQQPEASSGCVGNSTSDHASESVTRTKDSGVGGGGRVGGCGTEEECSNVVEEGTGIRHGGSNECGGGSQDCPAASDSDRAAARSTDAAHQECQQVKQNDNSKEAQQTSASEKITSEHDREKSQVSQGDVKCDAVLCHLAEISEKIETEVKEMMALSAEIQTRLAPRNPTPRNRLDLLEVYCEKDSKLTEIALKMGLKAKRFTREDGDLSTPAGRAKLMKILEEEQPRDVWMSPECKYWGNFSRWNSGRSPATAAKIEQGRQHERQHLKLCCEVFWFQVIHGRHFHLEQPQGSEALSQAEVEDIVLGTYRTVFDMCEVGGLRIPKGNNYLRKRTLVLTTSKEFNSLLDARVCRKNHQHAPILGQVKISGRWQNLSAFAARYSQGFSKNVCHALVHSRRENELPMAMEELCVPCFAVKRKDQGVIAGEI